MGSMTPCACKSIRHVVAGRSPRPSSKISAHPRASLLPIVEEATPAARPVATPFGVCSPSTVACSVALSCWRREEGKEGEAGRERGMDEGKEGLFSNWGALLQAAEKLMGLCSSGHRCLNQAAAELRRAEGEGDG